MILEGVTDQGAVVPVQVTAQGKLVAEGLEGPAGPAGPAGPEGPAGSVGEQGTFTPVIEGTTTAGSVSYGALRIGRYSRIGNMVTVFCAVAWSGGTGTGNLRVTGLPFTSNENYVTAMGATTGLSLTDQYAYGYTFSSNIINVGVTSTTGTSTAVNYPYDAAGTIWITLTYFIA